MNRSEPRQNFIGRVLYLLTCLTRMELIGGVIFVMLFLAYVAVINRHDYPVLPEPDTASMMSNRIH